MTLKRFAARVLIGLAIIFVSFVTGQALPIHSNGLVRNDPHLVPLVIEELSPNADAIGLTREHIENRMRLRLREAGLTVLPGEEYVEGGVYMYVRITVGPTSANIALEMNRIFEFEVGGQTYFTGADVWSNGGLTTFHTPDGDVGPYILSMLEQTLDAFLVDYFAENPTAGTTR